MNKGLHRFTLVVTGATFFLLIAGALVTSNDAGLATSDWPLSNGQVFPKMVGNLFWEHGHRMIATTVGLLTIMLVICMYHGEFRIWLSRYSRLKQPHAYFGEQRRWVRRLGLVALAGVVAQGLLGGLTVKLNLPLAVSSAHATLAQLFFCTMVSLSVFTSAAWQEDRKTLAEKGGVPLRYLCVAAVVTIFLQLILGATLRHSAPWDHFLPVELVIAHVGGAIAVVVLLLSVAFTVFRRHAGEKFLTTPARLALGLLGLQLVLGIAAYITRLASPTDPQPLNPMIGITVAHVACGALVFATTIVLTLRAFRMLRASEPAFELAPV
jgi:cytochrome c oxidase assembly protein subunit 15